MIYSRAMKFSGAQPQVAGQNIICISACNACLPGFRKISSLVSINRLWRRDSTFFRHMSQKSSGIHKGFPLCHLPKKNAAPASKTIYQTSPSKHPRNKAARFKARLGRQPHPSHASHNERIFYRRTFAHDGKHNAKGLSPYDVFIVWKQPLVV